MAKVPIPLWRDQPPTDAAPSVIARGMTVHGDVKGEGDLWLYGRVVGKVSARGSVHVGEGASLQGEISAGRIVVGGHVLGNLSAPGEISFLPTGELDGDLRTPRLSVAEGARLNGHVAAGRVDRIASLEEVVRREEARAYLREAG
jgi:cytoskeletal protein CcmA (bactofilin family)